MNLSSKRVNVLLAENGMKRKDLAAATGISNSNLTTILQRGSCTEYTAGRIAKGLGVSVEQITAQEGSP